MNLHLGGEWYLESDSMNLILKQKYISKQKGKSFGKEVIAERGYYRTIEQVLNAVLDKGIMQSDAENLESLKNDVAEIRAFLKAYCNEKEKTNG